MRKTLLVVLVLTALCWQASAQRYNVKVGGGFDDAGGTATGAAGGTDLDANGDVTSNGIATFEGGVVAGKDGVDRGTLTLWDGSGGNQPGYLRIATPDGTTYYLFMADDGTLRYHTSAPAANGDGTEISGAASSTFDENGIDITYDPASDADMDLITLGVTGSPKFQWDESENAFGSTHDFAFSAAYPQVFAQQGWFRVQPYAASGATYLRLAPDSRDDSSTQYIYLFDSTCGTGPGYVEIREPGTTTPRLRFSADSGNLEARGAYTFLGLDTGSNETNYVVLAKAMTDQTDGTEDGELVISVQKAGSLTEALRIHDDLHLESKGNIDIPTGSVYKINNVQIATTDLSDEADIVKSVTLSGDSGSDTINDGDTLTIAGGTDIETSVAGDTVTVAFTGSGGRVASDGPYLVTHFLGTALPDEFTSAAAGAGSAVGFTNAVGGQYRLTAGTAQNGSASLYIGSNATYMPWSSTKSAWCNVRLTSAAITDATSHILIGFINAAFLNDDAAYFLLTKGTNSDQWQCVTKNENSAETTNTTGSYTSMATYSIETTASSVVFKIDGATVATHTTQVPDEPMWLTVYGYQKGNPGTAWNIDLDRVDAGQGE